MEVRGPTLTLRPPTAEDVPALLELGSDPEVTRWFSWGPYRSADEPAAYVRRARARQDAGEQLDLLVVHREAGPIGVTGLSEWSLRDRRAVVGTWFGRAWWGSGVNAESKALVFALAFAGFGLARVGAYADVRHERSQRALEKVGFTLEGTLRAWHRHGDTQKDVRFYGLLRADWETSPLREVPCDLHGDLPPAFLPG
ncbi:GNAT family N-acetyltransferase [Paraconexibacter algicola]|uniref:N-acetyltransferase n=1 Tax=Paraconexibacter algicola TaxID=2133960 RepID=A0A2T4UMX5_9ACTN|nr:GNAT family N-acetyltransferase [Paraconexibacter algicola]PTL60592.1 N-acetyltransferase [Paraconexibacter algicola]